MLVFSADNLGLWCITKPIAKQMRKQTKRTDTELVVPDNASATAGNVVPIGTKRASKNCVKQGQLFGKAIVSLEFAAPDGLGLVVDNFAGGGGASTGISQALGRCIDIAINHDREAIAMHATNHPDTHHYCEDVFAVKPEEVTHGRKVGFAWFSPDCKHFSKAKGGKPVSKNIRGLAWVAVKWMKDVKPAVCAIENVEELVGWGPLLENGKPDPSKKGQTFKRWLAQIRGAGYVVEYKLLRACDYGAPTIRKRLFVVARCDGQPIVWPAPTHGPAGSGLLPYRTAAECIDFNAECPSIFSRKKDLAHNTLKRIAKGLRKYVFDAVDPFIVPLTHHGSDRVESIREPMMTITGAHRGERALVAPVLATYYGPKSHGGDRANGVCEPLPTVTTENRFALIAPTLVQVGYGERQGQEPRALDIGAPLGTVVGSQKHALVSAFIVKHYGDQFSGKKASGVDEPLPTITTRNTQNQLVTATLATSHLVKLRGDNTGQAVQDPLATISAQGTHHGEVRAYLVRCGADVKNQSADVSTMLIDVSMLGDEERAMAKRTAQFLQEYLPDMFETPTFEDAPEIVVLGHYFLIGIGMRMLQPRELYKAQGFPDDYEIEFTSAGVPLTKTAQVRMVGNSVSPPVAEAITRSNVPDLIRAAQRKAA